MEYGQGAFGYMTFLFFFFLPIPSEFRNREYNLHMEKETNYVCRMYFTEIFMLLVFGTLIQLSQ